MNHQQALLDELLAKQALHELNAKYCRAVDRLDTQLMQSLWHPDAKVDVGIFEGSAADYSVAMTQPNEGMVRSFHAISNELYRVAGDRAWGEVYVTAAITVFEGGEKIERLVGGRYIDQFERRGGSWKFLHRYFALDWSKSFASSEVWNEDVYQAFTHHGARGGEDLSFAYFN